MLKQGRAICQYRFVLERTRRCQKFVGIKTFADEFFHYIFSIPHRPHFSCGPFSRMHYLNNGAGLRLVRSTGPKKVSNAIGIPAVVAVHGIAEENGDNLDLRLGRNNAQHG
jgi:hypothetical protein